MVLQKRLYYGFNGYQAPPMPRGSRSARGKRVVKKKVEENQLCPFELLAAVAGKLLLEKETASLSDSNAGELKPSTASNFVKQEQQNGLKTFKVEPCDQGSCDEGKVTYEICHQRPLSKFALKRHTQVFNSVILGPASTVKSDQSGKIGYPKDAAFDKSVSDITENSDTGYGECSAERQSPCYAESNVTKVEGGSPLQTVLERTGNGVDGSTADLLCSEDLMELDSKPPTVVSSVSSIELPPYGNNYPLSNSFTKHSAHGELSNKIDDEIFSRCSQPRGSKSSKPQRVGDRRIRKLLASKFWKVGQTLLKGFEFSHNDTGIKPFHGRKMCYNRQRTQRYSFKRKRLFERRSVHVSCSGISNETISKSFEMHVNEDEHAASFHGALNSEERLVKLNIKTIKLPELFIDMPESSTVGDLKRAVLEAVNSVLKNGFRIGVFLQGKKIPDDTKTLRQSGICHGAKLENLGFSLERHHPETTLPSASNEDFHFLDGYDSSKPLSWLPAVPAGETVTSSSPDHLLTSVAASAHQAEKVSSSTPSDMSVEDKTTTNSKALIVAPAASVEALAVVPLHRKSRRSDVVQRRIRRPFSVVEVEALVQAVETLGTGRWRDVKLQAFENAKHRTYVDLKDKWKTLVHTARISPQQRRGEPVPQELLDRVLASHAYWSQQQAKLQNKLQQLA